MFKNTFFSKSSSNNSLKYSSPTGLTIQPSLKMSTSTNSSSSASNSGGGSGERSRKASTSDLSYLSKLDNKQKSSSGGSVSVKPSLESPSIFTNPLSLASNQDKSASSALNSASIQNSVNSGNVAGLPASILR